MKKIWEFALQPLFYLFKIREVEAQSLYVISGNGSAAILLIITTEKRWCEILIIDPHR